MRVVRERERDKKKKSMRRGENESPPKAFNHQLDGTNMTRGKEEPV